MTVNNGDFDLGAFHSALAALGIDPSTVAFPVQNQPELERESYRPPDDSEWSCVERHISDAARLNGEIRRFEAQPPTRQLL